jgi:hypothetical protein
LSVVSSLAIVLKLAICGMPASAEVVVEAVPGVSWYWGGELAAREVAGGRRLLSVLLLFTSCRYW